MCGPVPQVRTPCYNQGLLETKYSLEVDNQHYPLNGRWIILILGPSVQNKWSAATKKTPRKETALKCQMYCAYYLDNLHIYCTVVAECP